VGHIPVAKPSPIPGWSFPRRGLALALLLAGLIAVMGVILVTAYPTGTRIDDGPHWETVTSDPPTNQPVRVITADYKLWVVHLGTGEVLALSSHDPGRGCEIQWRPDFNFDGHKGWFRESCLGTTYALNGVKIFGPSPRGMDRYEARVYGGDVQIFFGPKTLKKAPAGTEAYVPHK
jgi:hypothetical protein